MKQMERNDANTAQRILEDRINAEEWFALHNVTVLRQNKRELKDLIRKELAQLEGVLVVLTVDHITNLGQGGVEVTCSAICTESVAINRLEEDYASAMDVAEQLGYVIDGDEIHWDDIGHSAPDEGVLSATSRFKMQLVTR